jgi:hypothetical protein
VSTAVAANWRCETWKLRNDWLKGTHNLLKSNFAMLSVSLIAANQLILFVLNDRMGFTQALDFDISHRLVILPKCNQS